MKRNKVQQLIKYVKQNHLLAVYFFHDASRTFPFNKTGFLTHVNFGKQSSPKKQNIAKHCATKPKYYGKHQTSMTSKHTNNSAEAGINFNHSPNTWASLHMSMLLYYLPNTYTPSIYGSN